MKSAERTHESGKLSNASLANNAAISAHVQLAGTTKLYAVNKNDRLGSDIQEVIILEDTSPSLHLTPKPPAEKQGKIQDTETTILSQLASLTSLINNRSDALEKMVSSNLVVIADAVRDTSKQIEGIKESLGIICADLKDMKRKLDQRVDCQKTQDCKAAEERTSSLKQIAASEVHLSVFHKTKLPQVGRCTVCCTHFHCPICPAGMYKPRSKAMVLQHLEIHKKNALQHADFYVTKCHHTCRPGNSGHFHCPFCSRTTVKRQDAERHLKICQLGSALVEKRPQVKERPVPDRQENASTGDCRKVPEVPLPSNPSLDNSSFEILRANQKSALCHHCNVKILKKNMKKHIFRKHTNIAVGDVNASSFLEPPPDFQLQF